MADSELKLPGNFEKGTRYWIKGETLLAWREALIADRVVPGPGQKESQGPKGRVILGGEGGANTAACPLGGFEGGEMVPGFVIGGGASFFIEPGAITAAANKTVYIKATWTGDSVDDVLQAGGTMNNVTVHTTSGNVPNDDVPNINSLNGTAYYPLGAWDNDLNFIHSGCGTVNIDFCPGGFIKGR